MTKSNDTIREFNRFELKYVITLEQAEKFKKALLPFMRPDEHGGNKGKYGLTSLYYDSPELRCYWEKEFGLRFRRKLRIRKYEINSEMTEATPVFVEIKQRVDRVTQKRRVVLPYSDALRLCNDREYLEGCGEDQPAIDEMYVFIWQYDLRPVSIVRYDRQAFTGTQYDIGLRVTFDTNLTVQTDRLRIHEAPNALSIMPLSKVVMEIKVNERIPTWLTNLIADHNLRLERISKYCKGIDAAQRTPALRSRNLPAERSTDIAETIPGLFTRIDRSVGMSNLK